MGTGRKCPTRRTQLMLTPTSREIKNDLEIQCPYLTKEFITAAHIPIGELGWS